MTTNPELESKKATCKRFTLLKTLAAIKQFEFTSVGEGGESGYGSGSGYPGTGLRAPDMPLYNMPASWRNSVIKHLITTGLISGEQDEEGEWQNFKLTENGLRVLESETCPECNSIFKWYTSHGFTQTGERSGYVTHGRIYICKHMADKMIASSKGGFGSRPNFGITEGLA